MSRKLYVGNLAYTIAEIDLEDAFSKFGSIDSVRIINDHETGSSRGFGFVNFREDSSGITALEEMNGSEFNGRNLNVKVANDRPNPRG